MKPSIKRMSNRAISAKRRHKRREKSQELEIPIIHGVTHHKKLLLNGEIVYTFFHEDLGDFGQIFIAPKGNESQYQFEVIGEEDDPLIEKKKKLFTAITDYILNKISSGLGKVKEEKKHPSVLNINNIKVEYITCKKCNKLVAHIVHAENPATEESISDCATFYFSKAKELNIPTWVIGRKEDNNDSVVTNEPFPIFLCLKLWPIREEIHFMTTTELDDILCPLIEFHCK